jgi:HEAT repeat protein
MPYRRSLVPIAHRLAAWPALAIFAALCGNGHALADPLSRDPVTDFRQALVQEKDTVKDKEALRYRRETLTRKAQAIATPGEMSRVLLLQEWRVEGIGGDLIADIDREIRDSITDRFITSLKAALASGDSARSQAAAELITETVNAARAPGTGLKAGFLRQRLAGLTPELARLTESADPIVQKFAAEALGNIQGEPKLTINTLEKLIKTAPPDVRRAAADALANVIVVVASQQKRASGPDANRFELRKELLTIGTYAVPAAEAGLAASQPVEVRRLSADALQQLSSSVVDLTGEANPADKYPPPGRPWTTTEAQLVEADREDAAREREELRPLLDSFGKESAKLAASTADPDPYVRIQTRRVLEELAVTRYRMKRREASIPRGETVPPPKPDPKPIEKQEKSTLPKPGGAFLPSGVTPSGVPILLVGREGKNAPAPEKPSPEVPGAGLKQTLSEIVQGLKDPNVRARLGAVEVLETMDADAVPAIPDLVGSLRDPDRFVRWAAVRALGRLAPRSPDLVVPAIIPLLNDGDLDVEIAAASSLERFGPASKPAVAALGDRASRGDSDLRVAVMKALEAIGTDAAPALPSVARNLIARTREEREKDIGPDAGAWPAPRTRVAAAETLGHFGKLSISTLPALRQALSDLDPEVRRAASEAILKIDRK